MPYYEFVWTERALGKIDLNGVTSEEVEAVISNPLSIDRSHSSGRPLAKGLSDDGRMIVCVYEVIDELRVLPITAYYSGPRP